MAEKYTLKYEATTETINATADDRPSIKDLHNHVVEGIASKWRDFGVQLLNPANESVLDIIEEDHPKNIIACCQSMLRKWLETKTDATWNQLLHALRSSCIQLNHLADEIEHKLKEGTSITNSTTSSKDSDKSFDKLTSLRKIEVEFAKMTSRVKRALDRNKVSVAELIELLCAASAVSSKKVPIFDDYEFENIKSIDQLWRKLGKFWSIFDYDLLISVVDLTECAEAQEILDNFLARIDLSALENVVGLVLDCEEAWPLLRIKVNAEKCTLDVQNKVKNIISKQYDLQRYTLHFAGIKEGCIIFIYHISKAVASYLLEFKVTSSIMADFAAYNIIYLQINDMMLYVPPMINKIGEVFVWSNQDASIASNPEMKSQHHTMLPLSEMSLMAPQTPITISYITQLQEYCKKHQLAGESYTGGVRHTKEEAKESAAEVALQLCKYRYCERKDSSVNEIRSTENSHSSLHLYTYFSKAKFIIRVSVICCLLSFLAISAIAAMLEVLMYIGFGTNNETFQFMLINALSTKPPSCNNHSEDKFMCQPWFHSEVAEAIYQYEYGFKMPLWLNGYGPEVPNNLDQHDDSLQVSPWLNDHGSEVAPVIRVISSYSKKMENGEDFIVGDPFLTFKGGYQMTLRLCASGCGDGKDTHVSVYLHLMKGPHDDELLQFGRWPLSGVFAITLLNQFDDNLHCASYLPFNENICSNCTRRVEKENELAHGYGFDQLRLLSSFNNSLYNKNDSLYFRISYEKYFFHFATMELLTEMQTVLKINFYNWVFVSILLIIVQLITHSLKESLLKPELGEHALDFYIIKHFLLTNSHVIGNTLYLVMCRTIRNILLSITLNTITLIIIASSELLISDMNTMMVIAQIMSTTLRRIGELLMWTMTIETYKISQQRNISVIRPMWIMHLFHLDLYNLLNFIQKLYKSDITLFVICIFITFLF